MTSSKGAVGIHRVADPPETISISIVICCYTMARRALLADGVAAAWDQLQAGDELILVVDGNEALQRDLERSYSAVATVLPNDEVRGLSGARNTGLRAARGSVVVFLDDDAVLRPAALRAVRAAMLDPTVTALGGAVHPRWDDGAAPAWFPPEFGWVVGCDYVGLPGDGSPIRNPIGAAMAVRRRELVAIGGFSDLLGRVGTLPAGCEETLMGIELARHAPDTRIVRATDFAVSHAVPADRATLAYFVRRCYHEGRSKAILSRLCGRDSALEREKSYATVTLPLGVLRARHPGRMAAVLLGLLVTTAGYVVGCMQAVGRPGGGIR